MASSSEDDHFLRTSRHRKDPFVKALAGVLSWWYIEILPSMLMADGVEKFGANLHAIMEKARTLENAVIFIVSLMKSAGAGMKQRW